MLPSRCHVVQQLELETATIPLMTTNNETTTKYDQHNHEDNNNNNTNTKDMNWNRRQQQQQKCLRSTALLAGMVHTNSRVTLLSLSLLRSTGEIVSANAEAAAASTVALLPVFGSSVRDDLVWIHPLRVWGTKKASVVQQQQHRRRRQRRHNNNYIRSYTCRNPFFHERMPKQLRTLRRRTKKVSPDQCLVFSSS